MAEYKEKRKIGRSKVKGIPVFWKSFFMMLFIVLIAILVLSASSRILHKELSEAMLTQMQANLEDNCEELAQSMYMIYAIPQAVKDSKYYEYIHTEKSGTLPEKYYALLSYIGDTLRNQIYLQGDNIDCLIYFNGTNSICTRYRNFPVAEKCFDSYLRFGESSVEEILAELQTKNNVSLLPMQKVTVWQEDIETRGMALIIRPVNSSISVMSIISEETILERLGINSLPKGTYLEIRAVDGTILETYPSGLSSMLDETQADHYPLRAEMKLFGAQVSVWIPKTYFSQQMQSVYFVSGMFIIALMLLGVCLCFVLSDAATRPLRNLAAMNQVEGEKKAGCNEVQHLADVLERAKLKITDLQELLRTNLLIRAFSGAVLSELDEQRLEQETIGLKDPYRVAVLHTSNDVEPLLVVSFLKSNLPAGFYCEFFNEKEAGVLFHSGDEQIQKLENTLKQFAQEIEGASTFVCGISGSFEELSSISMAVRQARSAFPTEGILGMFTGPVTQDERYWLQHERFYQAILANEEADAIRFLRAIAKELRSEGTSREAFYHIRFLIRKAEGELNLSVEGMRPERVEYDSTLLPRENIERLEVFVRALFERMKIKQEKSYSDRQEEIMQYIAQNYSDSNLCAAQVAGYFGTSEKSIYTAVKKVSGMSFNEYLLMLRMKRAGVLLCTTRESVGEIAKQCGYQAESTFYRVFKKYYAVTPNQFRADGGQNESVTKKAEREEDERHQAVAES